MTGSRGLNKPQISQLASLLYEPWLHFSLFRHPGAYWQTSDSRRPKENVGNRSEANSRQLQGMNLPNPSLLKLHPHSLPTTPSQIYRVYNNNQEYELFRLNDSLSMPNETHLIVRLGRALKPGEFRVKLSLLRMREVEVCYPSQSLTLKLMVGRLTKYPGKGMEK